MRGMIKTLVAGSVVLVACGQDGGGALNNGQQGQVSMAVAGIPQQGRAFGLQLFVQQHQPSCLQGDCQKAVPIVGMAAGCENESVCLVPTQDPSEMPDNHCGVNVQAVGEGKTRLLVEVQTAGGEIRRDWFPMVVATPKEVRVDCQDCTAGAQEVHVTCHGFNQDVTPEALLGGCDALADGAGISLTGDGVAAASSSSQERGPHVVSGGSSLHAVGNSFTITRTGNAAVDITFKAGSATQHLLIP